MAFMSVLAPCYICEALFSFHASYVPSVMRVNGNRTSREPVCEPCMQKINLQRELKGLPPFAIHPDAYQAEEML